MKKQEIPFNYFYTIFKEKACPLLIQKELEDKEFDLEIYETFDAFVCNQVSNENKLLIYDHALHDTCLDYLSYSDSSIDIIPKSSWEFLDLILHNLENNNYKKSFLDSVLFICVDYLNCLGKGNPLIWSSEDEDLSPTAILEMNDKNEMTDFKSINLKLLDQVKILVRIVTMEANKQLSPYDKRVQIRIRKKF